MVAVRNKERDEEIRAKRAEGMSAAKLMEIYPMSRARMYQILNPEAAAGQLQRKKDKWVPR
jgi:Mor family transcriptional regulator